MVCDSDQDEVQKRRIMNFAKSQQRTATVEKQAVHEEKQSSSSAVAKSAVNSIRELEDDKSRLSKSKRSIGEEEEEEEDRSKMRIMAMASAVNARRGVSFASICSTKANVANAAVSHALGENASLNSSPNSLNFNEPITNSSNEIPESKCSLNVDQGLDPRRTYPGNKVLAHLHAERMARQVSTTGGNHSHSKHELTILSYNVWFREDVLVEKRMLAIGNIVEENNPDIVCFQEVTPYIYGLFSSSAWWSRYECQPTASEVCSRGYCTTLLRRRNLPNLKDSRYAEIPFTNSIMGRGIQALTMTLGNMQPLTIATSHLESPTGKNSLHSSTRVKQAEQAIKILDSSRNACIFIGDMNWSEINDGNPPFLEGWTDAWLAIHGPDVEGTTYDQRDNPMISHQRKNSTPLRLRLDRAWVKLQGSKPGQYWAFGGISNQAAITRVGQAPIGGPDQLQYKGRPLLPSDHFGLLLRLKYSAAQSISK